MALSKNAMLTLIAAIMFYVLGSATLYHTTQTTVGKALGQSSAQYGSGPSFTSYGLIIHTLVFALIFYFVLKKQN